MIDYDGTNLKQITHGTGESWGASFSPDGKHITFDSKRSGNLEIWIMDADGKNAVQLTHSGDGVSMCNTWSRDNKRIAFWSDRYGNADIFIMDVSAKKPGNAIYAGMLLIVFIGFLAYLGMYIKKRGRT